MDIYKELLKSDFPYKDYSLDDLLEFAENVNYFGKNKRLLLGKLILEAQKKDHFALSKLSKFLNIKRRTLEVYRQKAKQLE